MMIGPPILYGTKSITENTDKTIESTREQISI